MMIFAAEIMRGTAPFVPREEAIRRLKWSLGFFRTAPIILMMLSIDQAIRVDELQAVAGIKVKPLVPGIEINDTPWRETQTHSRIAGDTQTPGKLTITRNPDGTIATVYVAQAPSVKHWETR